MSTLFSRIVWERNKFPSAFSPPARVLPSPPSIPGIAFEIFYRQSFSPAVLPHDRYEVFYQVNVTDIDDKIILRARQNKLLDDYRTTTTLDQLAHDINNEICAKKDDTYWQKKRQALQKDIDTAAEEARAKNKEPMAAKDVELQFKAFDIGRDIFETAKTAALEALGSKNAEKAVEEFADELKKWLDETKGSDVTDNLIFEGHARKFEASFWDDMEKLGVRMPDAITRVTEYVPEVGVGGRERSGIFR